MADQEMANAVEGALTYQGPIINVTPGFLIGLKQESHYRPPWLAGDDPIFAGHVGWCYWHGEELAVRLIE